MIIALKAIALGFCFTLGMELALGLCFAFRVVFKGVNKNEQH